MRNLLILIFASLLTSCGSTYKLSTLNHDPNYYIEGTDVQVDVIDNDFDLARKFRTDDSFRWDFARFAMRQDMRWHYDFYWDNRMFRRSPFGSPFNYYWNSQQYWWNWASNSHFGMGFNHWDPFGFNNYGWGSRYYGYGYGWNNGYYGNVWGWRNRMNDYAWSNRYRTNTVYVNGRRGSTMSNQDGVGQSSMIESTKRRTNTRTNRTVVVDKDIVIDKTIIKLRRGNNNIRVYENPNNVPNNIRTNPRNYNRPENNSRTIRNYNRPENNNNTRSNNNTRPTRTYTPPPTNRNNTTVRSTRSGTVKRNR